MNKAVGCLLNIVVWGASLGSIAAGPLHAAPSVNAQAPTRNQAKPSQVLLPHAVHLSKSRSHTESQQTRELYVNVINDGARIFANNKNPIAVLIDGQRYEGNVFAKVSAEGYRLGAYIRPKEEGAIFVNVPVETAGRAWKQCQVVRIVVDPDGVLGTQGQPYTLPLHDDDYASDCRYREQKAAPQHKSQGLVAVP